MGREIDIMGREIDISFTCFSIPKMYLFIVLRFFMCLMIMK